MNRSQFYEYIDKKLNMLAAEINSRNKLNLLDLNIHAENFYLYFFNILFEWKLENLNSKCQNTAGIDLIDSTNKLIIQVSATNTKQKVESALSKVSADSYLDYRFMFICISKDASKLRKCNFKNPNNIAFTPEDDIFDLQFILRKILFMDIDSMNRVYSFIKKELGQVGNDSQVSIFVHEKSKNNVLINMVRDAIGQSLSGWKAYGNWSNPRGEQSEKYFLDEHVRLHNGTGSKLEGFSAVQGINAIRAILHYPATSIRLVGLSGVGKTRLLQALFDERIGENALCSAQVIYCDVGASPEPSPRKMAEALLAINKPTVLAVDNCSSELHKDLTTICSSADSLSLITVEYDVRDDQPEETEVFRLEAASVELIEKVIRKRFVHIGQVDARTIAEFSGGNARIAVALADTMRTGESLATLRNEDLFLRLFQQRHEPDKLLLKTAEICSLVYSFDGQRIDGDEAELQLIGSLAGVSADNLYEKVSELLRRQLIQQRGVWRAVLPQALANRLAKRALENIPLNKIYRLFENNASSRLLLSFSRRLGYLHESDIAQNIARKWLSDAQLLDDIKNYDNTNIRRFMNLAPLNPELTLSVIESMLQKEEADNFFSRENIYYNDFVGLLGKLAYDVKLFDRVAALLCRFALSENLDERNNSLRNVLKSLFYIKWSGTHALPQQRLLLISKLAESNIDNEWGLGLLLLEAALEALHFNSRQGFEFGARSRDYGFFPKSYEESREWYVLFIDYTVGLSTSSFPSALRARKMLAERFRWLWTIQGLYNELEFAIQRMSKCFYWGEGYIAIKSIEKYDKERMNPEGVLRLNNLRSKLEPQNVVEQARLYALNEMYDLADFVEGQDEGVNDYIKIAEITRALGCAVGANEEYFEELLPDIVSHDNPRLADFGQGLADGCDNYEEMLYKLREQLILLEKSKRNYQVVFGFLRNVAEKDQALSEKILDAVVTDKIFGCVFPWLQVGAEITISGLKRVEKAIELEMAPVWQYEKLAFGRFHPSVNDHDICELLRLISAKQNGAVPAVEILYTILQKKIGSDTIGEALISIGQEILLKYEFFRKNPSYGHRYYQLSYITKICFAGEEAAENAGFLCNNFANALVNRDAYALDYHEFLKTLATTQPIVLMDVFIEKNVKDNYQINWRIAEAIGFAMAHVQEDIVLKWCENKPYERYPLMASAIFPYNNNENLLEWKGITLKLIENSPNTVLVLEAFDAVFRPNSWSGSRADTMEKRLPLIVELKKHDNSLVIDWACKEERIVVEEIRYERSQEERTQERWDQRFEW